MEEGENGDVYLPPANTVKLDVWIELAARPNELAGPDE